MSVRIDNPNCFICGKGRTDCTGSYFYCDRHPEGPVRWIKYTLRVPEYHMSCYYEGEHLAFVDFSDPAALSSPA
jgi:hypothetical protein